MIEIKKDNYKQRAARPDQGGREHLNKESSSPNLAPLKIK